MRQPGRALLAAGLLAVMAMAGGCGATSSAPAITIEKFVFGPHRLVVRAGQTVSVANRDTVLHGFTADDGSFDIHSIAAGSSVRTVVSKVGVYPYHCPIHLSMTGIFEVTR